MINYLRKKKLNLLCRYPFINNHPWWFSSFNSRLNRNGLLKNTNFNTNIRQTFSFPISVECSRGKTGSFRLYQIRNTEGLLISYAHTSKNFYSAYVLQTWLCTESAELWTRNKAKFMSIDVRYTKSLLIKCLHGHKNFNSSAKNKRLSLKSIPT